MAEPEYRYVNYESFDDGAIVRIMLNRPETRNAQHRSMLVELKLEKYAPGEHPRSQYWQ